MVSSSTFGISPASNKEQGLITSIEKETPVVNDEGRGDHWIPSKYEQRCDECSVLPKRPLSHRWSATLMISWGSTDMVEGRDVKPASKGWLTVGYMRRIPSPKQIIRGHQYSRSLRMLRATGTPQSGCAKFGIRAFGVIIRRREQR